MTATQGRKSLTGRDLQEPCFKAFGARRLESAQNPALIRS